MKKLLLTLSGIALCMRQIRCHLLSIPKNAIATLGQRVEFECSTDLSTPLRWKFARVNSARFEFIYVSEVISHNFSSRYKVHTPRDGHWNLVIDSADMSYAGTYRCLTTPNYHIGEKETSASAELIVIDSHPRCSTNASQADVVEGDSLRMWCTLNYSGNWIPVMDVTRNSKGTVGTKFDYSYEPFKVGLTLSLVTQLSSSDNGATFMCRMGLNRNMAYSGPAKEGETKANNDPHYQHLWNYTANVLYGPRNQTIMLIDKALKVGSRLVCHADGNPAPSYGWELAAGEHRLLTNGSVIVIGKSMVPDEEQTLRCTATNVLARGIRNSTTSFFTFNLTDELSAGDKVGIGVGELSAVSWVGIGVVAGVGAALVICGILLAVLCKRYECLKRTKTDDKRNEGIVNNGLVDDSNVPPNEPLNVFSSRDLNPATTYEQLTIYTDVDVGQRPVDDSNVLPYEPLNVLSSRDLNPATTYQPLTISTDVDVGQQFPDRTTYENFENNPNARESISANYQSLQQRELASEAQYESINPL